MSMITIKLLARKLFALKILFCNHYFSPLDMYEKREGSGSILVSNGPGSGSGRSKNIRILRIPNTVLQDNKILQQVEDSP
jgi:hypothetical protein